MSVTKIKGDIVLLGCHGSIKGEPVLLGYHGSIKGEPVLLGYHGSYLFKSTLFEIGLFV